MCWRKSSALAGGDHCHQTRSRPQNWPFAWHDLFLLLFLLLLVAANFLEKFPWWLLAAAAFLATTVQLARIYPLQNLLALILLITAASLLGEWAKLIPSFFGGTNGGWMRSLLLTAVLLNSRSAAQWLLTHGRNKLSCHGYWILGIGALGSTLLLLAGSEGNTPKHFTLRALTIFFFSSTLLVLCWPWTMQKKPNTPQPGWRMPLLWIFTLAVCLQRA
jgi:hypothetical protein